MDICCQGQVRRGFSCRNSQPSLMQSWSLRFRDEVNGYLSTYSLLLKLQNCLLLSIGPVFRARADEFQEVSKMA